MRFGLSAVLALIVWYFMLPPVPPGDWGTSGTFVGGEPYDPSWRVAREFETQPECLLFARYSEQRLETMTTEKQKLARPFLAGKCIGSDDPLATPHYDRK